jgi:predicted nuclease of predicted toxin-antitoxin system
MRFLADECCDAGVVAELRALGHDVRFIAEEDAGADDDAVAQAAFAEGRILLTEDRDFGELTVRLGKPAVGIVFLRIAPAHRHLKVPRVRALIDAFGDRLVGHYTVVRVNGVRLRRLGSAG